MPPRYLYLDFPKHLMRNVSRSPLRAHTLAVESSIWCSRNSHCDKCSCAICKMRCMLFFYTVKTCLYALSEISTRSFFLQKVFVSPFLWSPLISCMLCRFRLSLSQSHQRRSLISFLNGTTNCVHGMP